MNSCTSGGLGRTRDRFVLGRVAFRVVGVTDQFSAGYLGEMRPQSSVVSYIHDRRPALGRHLISGPQSLPRCACKCVAPSPNYHGMLLEPVDYLVLLIGTLASTGWGFVLLGLS